MEEDSTRTNSYINFPINIHPDSNNIPPRIAKNDREEISSCILTCIPLYVQIVPHLPKEKMRGRGRKILNDHVCPTKWRLHRVSVSAFSRFSPDAPSIFILPMNLLRNLSLFIYPPPLPSLPVPGGRRSSPSFPLAGHFQPPGRETFRESANDWDCLVFYTVKRTGRGPSSMHSSGTKDRGDIFSPEGEREREGHPTITRIDTIFATTPGSSLKPFFIYFFFLPFPPSPLRLIKSLVPPEPRLSNTFFSQRVDCPPPGVTTAGDRHYLTC